MNILIYIFVLLFSTSNVGLDSNAINLSDRMVNSIEIGKKIYLTGIGESEQKIMAVVSGRELPASMMACANCHGKCGEGMSLQGISVPNIRRANHIMRYNISEPSEKIGKFLDSKLKRTIAMGLNHEGGALHNIMPKYEMSLTDMNSLISYLAVLGDDETCVEK